MKIHITLRTYQELLATEKGLYCTKLDLILGLRWKRSNCP